MFVHADSHAGDTIVGYALYQHRRDEFFPERRIVYLRQFLIEREYRRRGLGGSALRELFTTRFPSPCTVVAEVLTANACSAAFWQRVGFQPYQRTSPSAT